MNPNLDSLEDFNTLDGEAYKSISILFPICLTGDTSPSTILVADGGLKLVDSESEKSAFALFNSYFDHYVSPLKQYRLVVFNQFASPRKESGGFELIDRARTLGVAISILTGRVCFEAANFYYNDAANPPIYYKPFVHDELSFKDAMYYRTPATVSLPSDFDALRLIYSNLTSLNIWRDDSPFSRLRNAIRFYTYFNDNEWVLQKIAFAFAILEGIFSDSNTDITEKIAVRTAYFLCPDEVNKRHEMYGLLKIAYDCRSKFVHGSEVKVADLEGKLRKLKQNDKYSLYFDLPNELRDITSQALRKILTDPTSYDLFSNNQNLSNEQRKKDETNFYNQLVLGRM